MDPTPTEMERRVVRHGSLQPSKKSFAPETVGIPGGAYHLLARQNNYILQAPAGNKRAAAAPGVIGAPGLEILLVEAEPGEGPFLHNHTRTHEIFMCLSGCWEISWGRNGEHALTLGQYDLINVPPDVFRTFRNTSSEKAYLLAMVQGSREDAFNDVVYPSQLGDEIERRWGAAARANMRNIGIAFD